VQTTNPVNQANTSEQEIRALDRQWSEAQEKYDAAALDRIEAHDYVATYSNGRVLTKVQELKEVKAEKPKSLTVSISNDEEDVRI
jgi:translation initiation factor 2B subunit (eIF-2B alpha/beta/delta family)